MEEKPSREELKRRLRAKINGKRNGSNKMQELAKSVKEDPQTALMSMGIDDPTILACAKELVQNPQAVLKDTQKMLKEQELQSNLDEEAEEEMPPPQL